MAEKDGPCMCDLRGFLAALKEIVSRVRCNMRKGEGVGGEGLETSKSSNKTTCDHEYRGYMVLGARGTF